MGKRPIDVATTASDIVLPRRKKAHRRSARACEECRSKKRKCDGSQPCKACLTSKLDCVYVSSRNALNPTQRIRLLEQHLREASVFLQDLDKRLVTGNGVDVQPVLRVLSSYSQDPSSPSSADRSDDQNKKVHLTSMLAGCQRLISLDPRTTSYFGPQSEVSFTLRILELFDRGAFSPEKTLGPLTAMFNTPTPEIKQQTGGSVSRGDRFQQNNRRLPEKQIALEVIDLLFKASHPSIHIVDKQEFFGMVETLYANNGSNSHETSETFPALFHSVLALSYGVNRITIEHDGYSAAVTKGWEQFHTGSALSDVSGRIDMTSVQSMLCRIMFLISMNCMMAAHGLISLTYAAVLGLRSQDTIATFSELSQHELGLRTMVFAALVRVDLFVSLILDLPQFTTDTFVQDCVRNLRLHAKTAGDLKVEVFLKHLELLQFTCAARHKLFSKNSTRQNPGGIDPTYLTEVERALHRSHSEVSSLTSRLNCNEELAMFRYELEMTAHFSQIVLFRPFLHQLRIMADGKAVPLAQSRHALACIKVASTTILRSEFLITQTSGVALSWSTTYTVFLAVMCLIFLISAHDGTSRPGEAWKRAVLGIQALYAMKGIDDCASAGLKVIEILVSQLNHTVDFDFRQIEADVSQLYRQQGPSSVSNTPMDFVQSKSDEQTPAEESLHRGVDDYADADRMLAAAEDLPLGFGFLDLLNADFGQEHTTMDMTTSVD